MAPHLLIQVERLQDAWCGERQWLVVQVADKGGGRKDVILGCFKGAFLEAISAVNFVCVWGEVKSFWVDQSPNCTTTGGTLPANPG